MATQATSAGAPQSRWVRPLIPIAIVLVVGLVFLFIGSFIASAQSAEAAPFEFATMIPILLVGALVTYGLAVLAGDQDLWKFGTREVVYAAIGAALYGVLSWATNWLQLPSVSNVALRPAIVIPIFFGVVFGPVVGFFTGFVGNVLGDALMGWGVFPIWDIGNGLIGLVAGLSVAFASRKRSVDIPMAIVAGVCVLATLLIFMNPIVVDPFGDGSKLLDVSGMWWIPLLGIVLLVGVRYLARGRESIVGAQVWGALGIVIGIGFAAMADIWWNGYSFITAFLGEFVPAAGSNLINGLILLPILLTAWAAAQIRSGR